MGFCIWWSSFCFLWFSSGGMESSCLCLGRPGWVGLLGRQRVFVDGRGGRLGKDGISWRRALLFRPAWRAYIHDTYMDASFPSSIRLLNLVRIGPKSRTSFTLQLLFAQRRVMMRLQTGANAPAGRWRAVRLGMYSTTMFWPVSNDITTAELYGHGHLTLPELLQLAVLVLNDCILAMYTEVSFLELPPQLPTT